MAETIDKKRLLRPLLTDGSSTLRKLLRGPCTICSKLHAKRDQCIVARVRRFGAKVAASFVSHATAPGVWCHTGPHSVT